MTEEFTREEKRIIAISLSFLIFDIYGKMEWQNDLINTELQYIVGHQNSLHSALKKCKLEAIQ